MRRVCSIEGCEKAVKGRGWCSMHLQRFYKHGDPNMVTVRYAKDCNVEGCDEKRWSLGYCKAHYARFRYWGDPLGGRNTDCRLCGRKQHGLGLCVTHYFRYRKWGDPFFNGTDYPVCRIWTCRTAPVKDNLCSGHLYRLRNFGDPLGSPTKVQPCGESLPVEPLLRLVDAWGGFATCMARRGLSSREGEGERLWQAVKRARREGMVDVLIADEIVVLGLGLHPAMVWGDDWWAAEAAAETELEAAA